MLSLGRFPKKHVPHGHCLPPAGGGWRGELRGQRPPAFHLASPRWGDVYQGKHRAGASGEPFLEIALVAVAVLHTLPVVHPLWLMRPYHVGCLRIHWWRHMDQTAFRVHMPVDQQRRAAI